ncbi:uncharacterized protein MELLADRAFT_76228 [Melampsora larici-populina 98AG31]|uniref:Ubiquitin-like domain-containing protein n=1 Tax=Melampsora larici-populina (strain 98AG31 / pathotype 3-4-7) TaxID=747676 RepID=F4R355_MELLP|nr:uncharacterized protein MELLADRAFT_76228 [Melampsora larici-populina 98AG31]EGG13228.1 hypothetical protein MELLADRAFT_76228 [Melampsora larici-populina 98AG31]
MSVNQSDSGSEIEIITPSKPQVRTSPETKRQMNPPRRSSRLSTPRLSVTPAASPSPLNKETESPRVTPRTTRTSTKAAVRPPSSNSSLKSTSSSTRGSKKSIPASRPSSKLNAAPPDKRVSSLRQSKRRKTLGTPIDQSEETDTINSQSTSSTTAPDESTIPSGSQEIPPLKISQESHPSPNILEASEPQDRSAMSEPQPADVSVTDPQEATEIANPLEELAIPMHSSCKHTPEPDPPRSRSTSIEILDSKKSQSDLTPHEAESVPFPALEPLPNAQLATSPVATPIEPATLSATSTEPAPVSATATEPPPISTSIQPAPITATLDEPAPVSGSTIALGHVDQDRADKVTEDPMANKNRQTSPKIMAEASQDQIPAVRAPAAGGNFCNLSSRNPVQFVSKTLGLTAGDRRSASAVAPSSGVPENHSPERSTNVIYLSDEDSDKAGTSSSSSDGHTRRKKRKSPSVKLPDWTMNKVLDSSSSDEELFKKKKKGKARASSLSSDDSNDSDQPEPSKPTLAKSVQEKRAVRAPTPPPTMNPHLMSLNLHTLRCQLAVRSSSSAAHSILQAQDDPTEAYGTLDDLDESSLDPALAQVRRQVMTANKGTPQAKHHEPGTQLQWSGHDIQLSVGMVFDPRKIATSDPTEIEMYEEVFDISISTREPFSKVYEHLYAMNPQFPPDSIILARDNIKLSPWVTPHSVDMMTDTALKAYETDVWQFIKTNPVRSNRRDDDHTNNDEPTTSDSIEDRQPEAHTSANPSVNSNNKKDEIGSNHIKLTVRNGNKNGLEMIVKPTTTASSIIRQFLKEMADGKITEDEIKSQLEKCKLEFDGETLELTTKVQDTDIEDGEVLDLVFT